MGQFIIYYKDSSKNRGEIYKEKFFIKSQNTHIDVSVLRFSYEGEIVISFINYLDINITL